jgi:hypothetical protein
MKLVYKSIPQSHFSGDELAGVRCNEEARAKADLAFLCEVPVQKGLWRAGAGI